MRKEAQEDHGKRSRGWLNSAMPGSSSWMPYAPQGVKEFDDDRRLCGHYSKFGHAFIGNQSRLSSELPGYLTISAYIQREKRTPKKELSDL